MFSFRLLTLLFIFARSLSSEATIIATATIPKQSPACISLFIGSHRIEVQLALDEASREQGLMKQKKLGANEGMLFIFPFPQRVSFWMKETSLSLSVAYISSSGRIVEIHDLEPFNERSIASSSPVIVYALEVPRGWFTEHQILPGDIVTGLPSFSSAK
jgi:uncharacterized membrane protein (UPF0127 family)